MTAPLPSDKLKLLLAVATAGRQSASAGKASPPSAALVALVVLLDYLGPEGCFPAAETIAADSGMNLRTVQRGLDWLAEGGWIGVHGHEGSRRAGGRSNRYAFAFDKAEAAVKALYADRGERRAARKVRGQTTAIPSHIVTSASATEMPQFSGSGVTTANPSQLGNSITTAETPQFISGNCGNPAMELRQSVQRTTAVLPHESVTEPVKGIRVLGASLRDAPKPVPPVDIEAEFERWWWVWPFRVNKGYARQAFIEVLTTGKATREQIYTATRAMLATERDRIDRQLAEGRNAYDSPASWLRYGAWKKYLVTS